jgi:hypothetical protein
MRYRIASPPTNAQILRRASLGPAAIAARANVSRAINAGISQRHFMARGGSLGVLGSRRGHAISGEALGCCGLGSLGSSIPPPVVIGPIAARIIALRKQGMSPQAALLDAMMILNAQGVKAVTWPIHLQLAAGLQPFPSALSGFLGALGLAPAASNLYSSAAAGATAAGTAASVSTVAASALASIGSSIAIGQTAIPIPVVGAAIGLIIGAALYFGKRHVGKAEAAWNNQGFYNSLNTMAGRDYDEKQFSEAFKGMMDTGNNIVPGCGPDRHKNPDCLLGPMAAVIAQGYMSQAVPLSANSSQVFNTVVKPWLMSGAAGLVNGSNLARESIQLRMMQAATDRYLAGQAMTRGDMPSYGNQGAHTPTLLQALTPMLQVPVTTTPQQPPSNAGGPVYMPGLPPMVNVQDPSSGASPAVYVPASAVRYPYTGAGPATAIGAPPVNATTLTPKSAIPWGPIIAAGAAAISLLK